eukprot:3506863-Amphidinium_carterae.1
MNAFWNRLLPGPYGKVIAKFKKLPFNKDIRKREQQIPAVLKCLEAWEQVPVLRAQVPKDRLGCSMPIHVVVAQILPTPTDSAPKPSMYERIQMWT